MAEEPTDGLRCVSICNYHTLSPHAARAIGVGAVPRNHHPLNFFFSSYFPRIIIISSLSHSFPLLALPLSPLHFISFGPDVCLSLHVCPFLALYLKSSDLFRVTPFLCPVDGIQPLYPDYFLEPLRCQSLLPGIALLTPKDIT